MGHKITVNEEPIGNAIYQAVETGDEVLLARAADELWTLALNLDSFPEHTFQLLLELMTQTKFLELTGSWRLLSSLENMWDLLSGPQKGRLLPVLECAYPMLKDWMAWFVISELLGEYFMNEESLEVLNRLKTIEPEGPRSLVPHGFEHIAKDSKEPDLAKRAYLILLQMRNDPSKEVRDEVELSLRRLAARDRL